MDMELINMLDERLVRFDFKAESKEDALDKLRNDSYTDYLDFVLDDYSLEDADYDDQPFEIEEIEEE